MLHKLNLPTLESRRSVSRLVIFFKAIHGYIAIPTNHLQHSARTTRLSTGPGLTFTHVSSRCDTHKYSYFPRTIREWNKLDNITRTQTAIEVFKTEAEKSALVYY